MDFVIARGFELGPIVDHLGDLAASTEGSGVRHTHVGPVQVASTHPLVTASDGAINLFAGYVSINGTFLHPLLGHGEIDVARVTRALLAGREPDGGLYAVAHLDSTGTGRVRIDPLGQYPLYHLRRDRDFVVSTNPHLIRAVAAADGYHLTRGPTPAVDSLVAGGPLFAATLFEEVQWLLPGRSLRLDDRGLRVEDHRSDELAEVAWGAGGEVAFELTDAMVEAMLHHTRSVAAAVPEPVAVADITAGSDSRAALAVVVASGAFPELTGRCITRYPNPDANVAGAIMEHLGIAPGPYPVLGGGDLVSTQVAAISESAYEHGGVRDPLRVLPFAMADLVHFTGELGGGLVRIVPDLGATPIDDAPGALRFSGTVDRIIAGRGDWCALVTDDSVAAVHERLRSEMLQLEEIGVPRAHILGEVYLASRAKSHSGLANRSRNTAMVRPDLHATLHHVRLRRALHSDDLRNKRAMLDIILRTRPDLAMLPMQRPWDKGAVPHQLRAARAKMEPVRRATPPLSRFDGPLSQPLPVPGFGVGDRWTTRPAGPSRSRFAAAPTIAGSQSVLATVLEAAPPDHRAWEYFDRGMIEHVATRSPEDFDTQVRAGALGRAATGLVWMVGLDTPSDTRIRMSMRALIEGSG